MRFLVAGAVACIATCCALWIEHKRHPFGDHRQKAFGLWLAIVGFDLAIASLAIFVASETGSGSGGDIVGWVVIGLLAPFGARSPLFKDKHLFGREVDIGLLPTDAARVYLTVQLDRRMAGLHLRDHSVKSARILERGWSYGTLIAFVELYLDALRTAGEEEDSLLTRAYLTRGFDDERDAVNGLIRVILQFGSGMADIVCGRPPTEEESSAAPAAEHRARERVREEEAGPRPL